MIRHCIATVVLISVSAFACSAAPPPEPTSSTSPPAPPASATVQAPAPLVAVAGAPAKPAPEPSSEAPAAASTASDAPPPAPADEPKFFPLDVVTGREMAYLIDYAKSGASEVGKKSCAGKAEEDAAKHAECLTKAREKFGGDVLRFKKDDKGRVKLTIYRRSGSALAELFTANVQLKEISPNLVKVELKGGTGQRPIMRDRASFEMKVPNGYSIELEDPTYGTLVYEAKVGLVAN